ncbi:MAG: methyl-coenzyme M reductase operon protein D [Candidatus Syntropharchaeales archaeon]
MEVVVIPERLLSDETAGKVLARVGEIDGVSNIILQGPNYISRDLKIEDQKIKTTVKVGKIFVGVCKPDAIDGIKHVCDEIFTTFTYDLKVGRFSKDRPTVSNVLGKSSFRDLGVLDKK